MTLCSLGAKASFKIVDRLLRSSTVCSSCCSAHRDIGAQRMALWNCDLSPLDIVLYNHHRLRCGCLLEEEDVVDENLIVVDFGTQFADGMSKLVDFRWLRLLTLTL